MTRETFYDGKTVATIDWWLHDPDLPDRLAWGRRRIFTDGTADACFEGGSALFGFAHADSAAHMLAEDEFIRFPIAADDEHASSRDWRAVNPPSWDESMFPDFEYLGTY